MPDNLQDLYGFLSQFDLNVLYSGTGSSDPPLVLLGDLNYDIARNIVGVCGSAEAMVVFVDMNYPECGKRIINLIAAACPSTVIVAAILRHSRNTSNTDTDQILNATTILASSHADDVIYQPSRMEELQTMLGLVLAKTERKGYNKVALQADEDADGLKPNEHFDNPGPSEFANDQNNLLVIDEDSQSTETDTGSGLRPNEHFDNPGPSEFAGDQNNQLVIDENKSTETEGDQNKQLVIDEDKSTETEGSGSDQKDQLEIDEDKGTETESSGNSGAVRTDTGVCGFTPVLSPRGSLKGKELKNRKKAEKRLWKELHFLQKMAHPSIIPPGEVLESNLLTTTEEENITNLLRMLQDVDRFGLHETQVIVAHIASGLEFLHKNGIAHRDICPRNISIFPGNLAKISNFHLAVRPIRWCCSLVGTMPYIAVEVMFCRRYDPRKADVWSVGAVLLDLLCGRHTLIRRLGWETSRASSAKRRQMIDAFACPLFVPGVLEENGVAAGTELVDVFARTLCVEVSARWSSSDLFKQDWVQAGRGIIEDSPQKAVSTLLDCTGGWVSEAEACGDEADDCFGKWCSEATLAVEKNEGEAMECNTGSASNVIAPEIAPTERNDTSKVITPPKDATERNDTSKVITPPKGARGGKRSFFSLPAVSLRKRAHEAIMRRL